MILVVMKVFNKDWVKECDDWEEAEGQKKAWEDELKKGYPFGNFPVTYYFVKDRTVPGSLS